MRFAKGHGTENDFVLLPDPEGALDLTTALVRRLCDRRAGLGADGVLRVVRVTADAEARALPGSPDAVWFMDHRNADGSRAQMCGNGIRVYVRYLVAAGLATAAEAAAGELPVLTRSGLKVLRLADPGAGVGGAVFGGQVTVGMGRARLPGSDRKVSIGDRSWPAVEVDLGNPHAVVLLDEGTDLDALSPPGEPLASPVVSPPFPDGVNVELVVRRGEGHIAMRVHERGVGETRSCGTGACAAMVASARADGVVAPTTYLVDVPGGRLQVTERAGGEVELTGPAVLVAHGELDPHWLAGA